MQLKSELEGQPVWFLYLSCV